MVEKGLSVNGNKNGVSGSRGGSVKGILFFLFALAVCFGYFYFFTDVLRPKEETPEQPDVYTSDMKKPLPERLVQSTATSAEEAVSPPPASSALPEPPSPGGALTDAQSSGGDASSGQKMAQSAPVAEKSVSPPPPSAKSTEKAVGESAKPIKAAKKPMSAATKPVSAPATTRKDATKSSASRASGLADGAKKTLAGKKTASSTIVAKQTKGATPQKSKATAKQSAAKKNTGSYTLTVGTYVLKSSLLADKAKLEKAGLQTSVSMGKVKDEPMNRLLVAEVASYPAARDELNKVKKASKDAFLLRQNGSYAIYAGSYFNKDRAMQEQERLRKEGFAPILKQSQAPVSLYALTAGSYQTREAALKDAERLKKLGFNPYPALIKK
jgi:cell division septation protein DedD